MNKILDFDTMSTTRIDPDVLAYFNNLNQKYYANSESIHILGQEVHRLQEKARQEILELLNLQEKRVVFTSSASEANSLAIKGYAFAYQNRGKHLITTKIEHSSVMNAFAQLESFFGFTVTYLDVNSEGRISIKELQDSIRDDTILVSIGHINNEIGTIQDLYEIKNVLKDNYKITFHTDIVQSIGKYNFDYNIPDLLTISAHKINGFKGSGALLLNEKLKLMPLINGGVQEYGVRGGTSNANLNITLAYTLKLALAKLRDNFSIVSSFNQYLRLHLSKLGIKVNSPSNASVYILNISFPVLNSEIWVNALSREGILVSALSTCSAKSHQESYVLKALGLSFERKEKAIRIGLSANLTQDDIEVLLQKIKEIGKEYGL